MLTEFRPLSLYCITISSENWHVVTSPVPHVKKPLLIYWLYQPHFKSKQKRIPKANNKHGEGHTNACNHYFHKNYGYHFSLSTQQRPPSALWHTLNNTPLQMVFSSNPHPGLRHLVKQTPDAETDKLSQAERV